MSLFSARVLSIATTQIGAHEQPAGSNRGPEVDEYLRAVWLDPTRGKFPWCAAFVCWCIQRAADGWAEEVRWRSSAKVARLVVYNKPRLIAGPLPGCVFIHLNEDGTGHTGFVTGIRDDGLLVTLEGNTDEAGGRTGGKVMVHHNRPLAYAQQYLQVA